jgi:LPPG:FO 2-phospho-L-lactate transferase
MMAGLGLRADALGVAERYADVADHLVIDHQDANLQEAIRAVGLQASCRDIMMRDLDDKRRLASEIVALAGTVMKPGQAA